MPGRVVVVVAWWTDALFAVTAIPAAAGVDALDAVAVVAALVAFAVGLGVWGLTFWRAVTRSVGGEDLAVGSLYVTVGDAPPRIRAHLFGALGVCVAIAAATAVANPFGVLVPMLPLGLVGLWAARHGTFPPRSDHLDTRSPRAAWTRTPPEEAG